MLKQLVMSSAAALLCTWLRLHVVGCCFRRSVAVLGRYDWPLCYRRQPHLGITMVHSSMCIADGGMGRDDLARYRSRV